VSLLIDALRQAEAAQRAQNAAEPQPGAELQLEPVSAAMPPSLQTAATFTPSPRKRDSTNATIPTKEAVKDLFELKQAKPSHIPLVLAAGGLLALIAGSAYLWLATNQSGGIQAPSPGMQGALPAPQPLPPAEPVQPPLPRREAPTVQASEQLGKPESVGQAGTPEKSARALFDEGSIRRSTTASSTTHNPLQEAREAYQQGRLAEAYQRFADIIRSEPGNIDALDALGLIALRMARPVVAEQHFRQALQADPKDAQARSQLALIYGEGDPISAESRLRGLLAEQPESAPAHFALGSLYARQERWVEAQQSFFQAHTLDKQNADTLYNLAVALDHLRQERLAAQYYERAASAALPGASAFDPALARSRAARLNEAGTPPAP
jgi:Tfp pilus assembly protein PilF